MSKVYLSWGMGVESSAILTRWLSDPSSRDFPLSDLTVITAQTGDEWRDTKALCETHIFPLLRQHRVRLVQVARAGRLEEDGIEVLDDTDYPEVLHIEGAYRLSDELLFAGTVPQFAGVHKCALKFKAFVLESWLADEAKESYRHAFGYNSEETGRVEKSEYAMAAKVAFGFNSEEQGRIARANEYDSISRTGIYPLMEWNWNREACVDFLRKMFGVTWKKSACVYCPFNAMKGDAIARLAEDPEAVASALLLEYTSLCLNHRSTLYRDRSLMAIVRSNGHTAALEAFEKLRSETDHALYRVRRIMTSKGKAHRCTEQVTGEYLDRLLEGLPRAVFHAEDYDIRTWVVIDREAGVFPTREEFYVEAPTSVGSRARYGIPWFDQRWDTSQASLF